MIRISAVRVYKPRALFNYRHLALITHNRRTRIPIPPRALNLNITIEQKAEIGKVCSNKKRLWAFFILTREIVALSILFRSPMSNSIDIAHMDRESSPAKDSCLGYTES